MKRVFDFIGTDGKTIATVELAKLVSIDTETKMFSLEEMKDGRWRLIYSKGLIPEMAALDHIKIRRDA